MTGLFLAALISFAQTIPKKPCPLPELDTILIMQKAILDSLGNDSIQAAKGGKPYDLRDCDIINRQHVDCAGR